MQAGDRVGDYRLEHRLGRGAGGEVWFGRHTESDTEAAVKIAVSDDVVVRTLFARERAAVVRLSHPHVVQAYAVGDDYIASAFVQGHDLSHRLRTPISTAQALFIARQIASALAHCHDRQVVHRDVNPNNILIDTRGNAFLADFGLALCDGKDDGIVAGTRGYMPKEQAEESSVGPAVDQYALARTLLRMLYGRELPESTDEALAALPVPIPRTLEDVLRRATRETPSERFGSMRELLGVLDALAVADLPPPVVLLEIARDPSLYAWASRAESRSSPAPLVSRADFRLNCLPQARARAFREKSGYEELGWSIYSHEGRTGRADDPLAFARARAVVVLLHGWLCTRAVFDAVALGICRDNAHAVVLAPDTQGFGVSRFANDAPRAEQVASHGYATAVLDWLQMLGLFGDLPFVLVGHSMSAVALMTLTREELPPGAARVCLTPLARAFDPTMQRRMGFAIGLIAALRAIGLGKTVRDILGRRAATGKFARQLTDPARRDIRDELARSSPLRLQRIIQGVRGAVPATPLARCTFVIGADDPSMAIPQAAWVDAAATLGIGREQVRRFASGHHYPHLEDRDHPELTEANRAQIIRIVDDALASSGDDRALSAMQRTDTEVHATNGASHRFE